MLTRATYETQTLVGRFTWASEIQFGCNVPGHYPIMAGTWREASLGG